MPAPASSGATPIAALSALAASSIVLGLGGRLAVFRGWTAKPDDPSSARSQGQNFGSVGPSSTTRRRPSAWLGVDHRRHAHSAKSAATTRHARPGSRCLAMIKLQNFGGVERAPVDADVIHGAVEKPL